MKVDPTGELAALRSWRDTQIPSEVRDATVAGFLWALALLSDTDVSDLRAQLDAPRTPAAAVRAAGPVPPSASAGDGPVVPRLAAAGDPDAAPPWAGLGIPRIPRTRTADDGPPLSARAFTAGGDGRPVPLEASYAEMAADTTDGTRGLSDDTGDVETWGAVPADTTS